MTIVAAGLAGIGGGGVIVDRFDSDAIGANEAYHIAAVVEECFWEGDDEVGARCDMGVFGDGVGGTTAIVIVHLPATHIDRLGADVQEFNPFVAVLRLRIRQKFVQDEAIWKRVRRWCEGLGW